MQLFSSLSEKGVERVDVDYNWDEIMVQPKLVCWDKLTWKNIQQINNWNKVTARRRRFGGSCSHRSSTSVTSNYLCAAHG